MIQFPNNKRCSYEIETEDNYFIEEKRGKKWEKKRQKQKEYSLL